MEELSLALLFYFQRITRYDLPALMRRYAAFSSEPIRSFYSGATVGYPEPSFTELGYLTEEFKKVIDLLYNNRSFFRRTDAYALLIYVEDLVKQLTSLKNYNKFIASGITSRSAEATVTRRVSLGQRQSLADVERNVLDSPNPEDSWVDTAVSNRIREEDYDTEPGLTFDVDFRRSVDDLRPRQVFDVVDDSIKVYGRDVSNDFVLVFKGESGFKDIDLDVLSYEDTFEQSVVNLVGLKRGDNGTFLNLGVESDSGNPEVVYAGILRQLTTSLAYEEAVDSFSVRDIRVENNHLFIDVNVNSVLGRSVEVKQEE